ncbi:MAG: SIS domain-containing protein [Clostridia bacterium]|nr:SIS domain-containing protein [Clostridia bacterium]
MINLEKEIREQPAAIERALGGNRKKIKELVAEAKNRGIKSVYFCARGTSDHACIAAQYVFGIVAGIPCALGTPSVFTKYGARVDLSEQLVIGVSQSGKAEDVLAVLRSARSDGAITVAVTNDESSPMAKEAEYSLFCGAGPEVSIAATKTFTSQMAILFSIAAEWAGDIGLLNILSGLPEKVKECIDYLAPQIDRFANKYRDIKGAVILGRGMAYPIALEGALKMLETNKISMKGYAISDFHHGPIAQIKPNDPVFVIEPSGKTEDDVVSIIEKLRGVSADIIVVTDDPSLVPDDCEKIVTLSAGCELVSPFMTVLVFQLLACRMTEVRGIDPEVAGVINKITITK